MPPDPEQNVRFLGNRLMMELSIGRALTPLEQRILFNSSTKRLEKEIFGLPLPFDIREFNLRRDWRLTKTD